MPLKINTFSRRTLGLTPRAIISPAEQGYRPVVQTPYHKGFIRSFLRIKTNSLTLI